MIYVVGAVALDLIALRGSFTQGTSNPAEIQRRPGGVGFRLYRGLATDRKRLITAVGHDYAGGPLEKVLREDPGVVVCRSNGHSSAIYMAFMEAGELLVAASDMAVIREGLTHGTVQAGLEELQAGDFLLLEANLSPELVEHLLQAVPDGVRIVFEAVSVEKAREHRPVLGNLFLLSTTVEEAQVLIGNVNLDPQRVDDWLLNRRIEGLLVTRGEGGATLYTRPLASAHVKPPRVIRARDTTGAGDRLLCHYLVALQDGADHARTALERAVAQTTIDIEENTL